MKRYLPLLLAAAAMNAPLLAQTTATPDKLYRDIQAEIRKKNYTEAVTKAEQALQGKGLSAQDRARFLSIAAEASIIQGAGQYSVARKYYETILADAAVDNMAKVNAINGLSEAYIQTLAGQYLDRMYLFPAHTILERALKLPDLQPEERAAALHNIAKLYDREDKDERALETYRQILQLNVSDDTKNKVWAAMVDVHVKQALYGIDGQRNNAIAGAVSISQKQGFDLVALYKRVHEFDKATAILLKTLDDVNATDEKRWAAFSQLPALQRTSGPGRVNGRGEPVLFRELLVEIRQLSDKYLPALLKEDPSRARLLLQTFKEAPVAANVFYYPTNASPAYVAWAGQKLLEVPKLSDADYKLVRTKYIDALAALRDDKRAAEQATAVQNDPRLDAATHFWARLVSAALTTDTPGATGVLQAATTLPNKDKAQTVLDAAQTVLLAGQENTANALYDAYQKIVPPLPVATVNSAFMPEAPNDVGSWLASPLLKDKNAGAKFDRPYGDNLKLLLETDATTGDRAADATAGGATGDHDTDFYVACDAQGVHLFFDARDAHAQEVVDGLLRGSRFETYLAPGENQPYYFFYPGLPEVPVTTGPTSFQTMYPNTGWRLPSTTDGTFRSDIRRTEDGFGISMFLSWELFYDKLPTNGTTWQFESIRWTRSGGYSFAGSQSVHNRSSWGDIIFSGLTTENRNAIKRAIVFKAVAKYRTAKAITAPVGRWADAELGDPNFYRAEVAPLLARLDQHAEKVNKEMTAAEVETLFEEAVPGWMELDFRVEALRTQYLKKKQLRP